VQGAGRILLAANNTLTQPTLLNGEGSNITLTGERAPNVFLITSSQTPYLPDTVGGPAVSGIVTEALGYEGQPELDTLIGTLPAGEFPLSIASETSPFDSVNGNFNELFLTNLSDDVFQNLVLTIDGVGTGSIVTLNPGESWTTLVPAGDTQGTISLISDGIVDQTVNTIGLGPDYIVGVSVPEPTSGVFLTGILISLLARRRRGAR
jgi:hypothetical protein